MSSERVAPHGIYPLAALTVDVVDTANNVVSVVIAGELDADTAAGIRTLLQAACTVNAYGGVLVLRWQAPFIRYALTVAGALDHVDLDDAEKPAT
ncbi:hypothetical protein Q0Z83_041170 [Actinoplanes sichuanensis]|uniref:STAS domain-containing protein n=1 Tax=Actinoplanes sichuanensis TaxID=512349 RepID=A0ABW4ARB0_9ACTN|nr:hypothetical protein [Actinoplanes sichuanensis]BEL05926.1 hypothetical protein Q0Z83_041170 [Actinoplanes sichuanensis]